MEPEFYFLAPRGMFLTMTLWPDTPAPRVAQLFKARATLCLDKDWLGYAEVRVGPGGTMMITRVAASEE